MKRCTTLEQLIETSLSSWSSYRAKYRWSGTAPTHNTQLSTRIDNIIARKRPWICKLSLICHRITIIVFNSRQIIHLRFLFKVMYSILGDTLVRFTCQHRLGYGVNPPRDFALTSCTCNYILSQFYKSMAIFAPHSRDFVELQVFKFNGCKRFRVVSIFYFIQK